MRKLPKVNMAEVSIFAVVKGYHKYKYFPELGAVGVVVDASGDGGDTDALAVRFRGLHVAGHVPATPIKLHRIFRETNVAWQWYHHSHDFTCINQVSHYE